MLTLVAELRARLQGPSRWGQETFQKLRLLSLEVGNSAGDLKSCLDSLSFQA